MNEKNERRVDNEPTQNAREYYFYPEVEGGFPPIKILIVGSPEDSKDDQKSSLGKLVAAESAKGMAEIIKRGKKVLWSMATGSTFNWKDNLPTAFEEMGVDPQDIIPIVKEDGWDKDGRHFPPGDDYDFRGKRISSFHDLFGIEPKNVSVSNGEIEGNLVAPDYDMSAEEGRDYMSTTWSALMGTGQVEGFTTTGIGEDMHVGESQINKMGLENQMGQMDFFVHPISDYSYEKGLFKWLKNPEEFSPENNVFVEQGEGGWQATGRTATLGENIVGGRVLGMGWRQMLETAGGAIFAFDGASKALAAKSAIAGSMSGVIKDRDGIEVAKIRAQRGEGIEIWDDLVGVVNILIDEGILGYNFLEIKMGEADIKDSKIGLINDIFKDIYNAYLERGITPKKAEYNQKYFQPLWRLVNRYLGLRSPASIWLSQLYRNGTPLTLVLTRQAATELPQELLEK